VSDDGHDLSRSCAYAQGDRMLFAISLFLISALSFG
jgi:hypothetical protein